MRRLLYSTMERQRITVCISSTYCVMILWLKAGAFESIHRRLPSHEDETLEVYRQHLCCLYIQRIMVWDRNLSRNISSVNSNEAILSQQGLYSDRTIPANYSYVLKIYYLWAPKFWIAFYFKSCSWTSFRYTFLRNFRKRGPRYLVRLRTDCRV